MPLSDDGPPVKALSARGFARRMAALGLCPADGPVAVAVSGGLDSMALVLLAAGWGPVLALTVDHGLRCGSREEAERVHAFLRTRGIDHRILRLAPDDLPPGHGSLEARARLARYAALEEACAAAGIRHLLLAHTLEDQAETVLLRLLAGSGLEGLAAMAERAPPLVVPDGPVRLRPLIGVSRARLAPIVAAAGWEPVQDPMNADERFARVRVRRWLAAAPDGGRAARRIAAVARKLARAQAALDAAIDALLEGCLTLSPAGFARLEPSPLRDAPEEVALRALTRLIRHVGGAVFPPREAAVRRLLAHVTGERFAGATLAGVLLVPWRGRILLCREPAALAGPVALRPGRVLRWDDRFLARAPADLEPGWTLGPLGARWRAPVGAAFGRRGEQAVEAVPGPARPGLACLRDPAGRLVAIAGLPIPPEPAAGSVPLAFAPVSPLFRKEQSLSA